MKSLEKLIEKKLKQTKNCDFKKAFIPKGYACVNIKIFSKELAEEIEKADKENIDEIIKLVRKNRSRDEKE